MADVFLKLAKRQLLGDDDEEDEDEGESCPTNFDDLSQADPITGSVTFHDLMIYISIPCMVITLIVSGYLVLGQVRNYREPRVQKHLIRIIVTAPVFSVLCFIGVASYGATHYVEALAEFYEVFTLHALFLLFIAYLVPTTNWETQVAFFSNPKYGGFKFFKKRYLFVMQVIPVKLATTLGYIITTGVECWMDRSSRRASTILAIIDTLTLIIAIMGIFPFVLRNQAHIQKLDPQILSKLISVKLIVVARVLLNLVLSILGWTDSMEATDTLSYNDLNVGLSVFITCILAMVTSLIMLPFYRPKQFQERPLVDFPGAETGYAPRVAIDYDDEGNAQVGEQLIKPEVKPKAKGRRALLDVLNIIDVLRAVARGVRLIGKKDGYTAPPEQELPEYRQH